MFIKTIMFGRWSQRARNRADFLMSQYSSKKSLNYVSRFACARMRTKVGLNGAIIQANAVLMSNRN